MFFLSGTVSFRGLSHDGVEELMYCVSSSVPFGAKRRRNRVASLDRRAELLRVGLGGCWRQLGDGWV